MPITSSAKKAEKQSIKRQSENSSVKRIMRSTIKEIKELSIKDLEKAKEILPRVYKSIDKAAKKGIIKKNNASRKKSNVMKFINKNLISN